MTCKMATWLRIQRAICREPIPQDGIESRWRLHDGVLLKDNNNKAQRQRLCARRPESRRGCGVLRSYHQSDHCEGLLQSTSRRCLLGTDKRNVHRVRVI
ncbi:Hypothetical protein SMAX5B_004307 [Scophthalmus maximus]|uniref:Uncharacterized protein n=1 Tax=Scophthalmus maximus TaxID=52904 RepID=A0A2U9B9F0_SCOMX|nr:Hypothetical protein SMAX5B_004307 [Scophthalmus maximus]KAF0038108.1 hypothetical protein F2P81_008592 [Scophthalmus maximus]